VDTTEHDHYESPELRVEGSVEELTHGADDGNFLDQSFPVNTPRGDLTFS
jgi:hypothetical protein